MKKLVHIDEIVRCDWGARVRGIGGIDVDHILPKSTHGCVGARRVLGTGDGDIAIAIAIRGNVTSHLDRNQ